MTPAVPPATSERERLSLDLSPAVSSLLHHVSTVTGIPKSQLAIRALLDALPDLLERSDGFSKRHQALAQALGKGKR